MTDMFSGSITTLLQIMQSVSSTPVASTTDFQHKVVDLILNIFVNCSKYGELGATVNQILISQGLSTLVKLVTSPNMTSNQTKIINIIFQLISDRQSKDQLRKSGGITALMSVVSTPGTENLLLGLATLTKLVDGNDSNALAIVEMGGLVVLNDFMLSGGQPEVTLQSLYCLNCVASSSEEVVKLISSFAPDMVTNLVRLANTTTPDIMGASVQLLGTMSTSVTYRQSVASATKHHLSTWLDSKTDQVKRSTLRLIGHICASPAVDDPIRDIATEMGLITEIINTLTTPSTVVDMYSQASYALKQAARSYANRETILNNGALPKLINLCTSLKNSEARVRISEVLAAFSGEDRARRILMEAGGVGVFVELLFSDIDQLQKNATMIIGNFARDESLADEIIQRGGGIALVSLASSADDSIVDSAVLAIGNLSRNPSVRSVFVSSGAVEAILIILQRVHTGSVFYEISVKFH